jgi:hypothetical protein
MIVLGLLVFAGFAWALGDLNGPYLAFAGAFAAVLIIGQFIWPTIRGRSAGRAPT